MWKPLCEDQLLQCKIPRGRRWGPAGPSPLPAPRHLGGARACLQDAPASLSWAGWTLWTQASARLLPGFGQDARVSQSSPCLNPLIISQCKQFESTAIACSWGDNAVKPLSVQTSSLNRYKEGCRNTWARWGDDKHVSWL